MTRLLAACLLAIPLVWAGVSWAQDAKTDKREDGAPVRPPTKVTQFISAAVFKKFESAQKSFDAKNYQEAIGTLDQLKSGYDKLNDYEKATLWNTYATLYYTMDDLPKALDAYQNVLKQNNLPEGLRNSSLFAVAQLYFITEQYRQTIKVLTQWFKLVQDVQPDAHMLMAQAHYQLQDYAAAEKSVLQALRIAQQRKQVPKENWLALLRAVYYELENFERTAKILELLVAYYPRETYWLQLAGVYGLLEKQKDQLATLRAAYEANMLSREAQLLDLARLYMIQEAPYPAVKVLKRGFAEGKIKEEAGNLQLYAQALSLAQEYEAQIPVLEKLAAVSNQASHFLLLGQAHMELGHYDKSTQAFRSALQARKLERPGEARMLLGTSLYNQNEFSQAREVFRAVLEDKKFAEQAESWVNFMTAEIQRRQVLVSQ